MPDEDLQSKTNLYLGSYESYDNAEAYPLTSLASWYVRCHLECNSHFCEAKELEQPQYRLIGKRWPICAVCGHKFSVEPQSTVSPP